MKQKSLLYLFLAYICSERPLLDQNKINKRIFYNKQNDIDQSSSFLLFIKHLFFL